MVECLLNFWTTYFMNGPYSCMPCFFGFPCSKLIIPKTENIMMQYVKQHYCLKAELEGISGAQLLNSKFGQKCVTPKEKALKGVKKNES